MNYIRKITALILSVIFCVALIISMSVMFALKNVNVEFISSSGDYVEAYQNTKDNLNRLKGTNLLWITQDDIFENIEGGGYISVSSFKKVFPCTLNIVLKERVECFAVASESGYNIFDSEGNLIDKKRKENINVSDGSPNVLVKAESNDMKSVALLSSYVKEYFSGLRNVVKYVSLDKSPIPNTDTVTFELYCGVKLMIVDFENLTKEKVEAAFLEFRTLTDSQKLSGTIRAFAVDGTPDSVDALYLG